MTIPVQNLTVLTLQEWCVAQSLEQSRALRVRTVLVFDGNGDITVNGKAREIKIDTFSGNGRRLRTYSDCEEKHDDVDASMNCVYEFVNIQIVVPRKLVWSQEFV